jgi:hypothetical protein
MTGSAAGPGQVNYEIPAKRLTTAFESPIAATSQPRERSGPSREDSGIETRKREGEEGQSIFGREPDSGPWLVTCATQCYG